MGIIVNVVNATPNHIGRAGAGVDWGAQGHLKIVRRADVLDKLGRSGMSGFE